MDNQEQIDKKVQEEMEKEIEKNVEQEVQRQIETKLPNAVAGSMEGIIGALCNIIFLVLINKFYTDIRFLSPDFKEVLPWVNFSLVVSLVLYVLTIFVHSQVFKSVSKIITNIVFFFVAYQMWTVFPFDTSFTNNPDLWSNIIKGIIILSVLGVVAATIVEIAKFFPKETKETE